MENYEEDVEPLDGELALHDHCQKCFNQNCTHSFKRTCKFVPCENKCGAFMHLCKLQDHLLICLNSIQPCINADYGCPYKLRRKQMAKHLNICPASVVVCTMEWNRKPLDLESTVKMTGFNPNAATFNHFDVTLALTDQRVLLQALISNEILEQIIKHNESSQKVVIPFTSTSLGKAKENIERFGSDSQSDFMPESMKCGSSSHAATNHESLVTNSKPDSDTIDNAEIPKVRKPLLRTKFRLAPKKEFRDTGCDTSDLKIDITSMEWMNPGVRVLGFDFLTCIFEMLGAYEKREQISNSHTGEGLRCTLNDFRLCSFKHVATQSRPFHDTRKHCGKVGDAVHAIFEQNVESYVLSRIHNKKLYENLVLNQVMECLPRYEKKSRSLYTFMCNNLFRRDQFQSHVQNVHCEICSNLYGWLEEKCPYAQYGCNFAQFRFLPDSLSGRLFFDNSRGCFAVQSGIKNDKINLRSNPKDEKPFLLSLPWEILEHILKFLDSYSVGQLSQTSVALQYICVAFLKERGIVALNWEKFKRIDGNVTWQNTNESWYFTNSFTKIKNWVFNNVSSMSHHVSHCAVAAKHEVTYSSSTRIKLPPGKKKKPKQHHALEMPPSV